MLFIFYDKVVNYLCILMLEKYFVNVFIFLLIFLYVCKIVLLYKIFI